MDTLTDKPAGSVIKESLLLSWPAPDGRIRHAVEATLLALWLYGWTATGVVLAAPYLISGGPDPEQPGKPLWGGFRLGFWALGVGFALWGLWACSRPARPESVRLEAEGLRHDPGGLRHAWGHPARPKPTTQVVARADIRGFVLERVGDQQRLYLDRGTDRLEIGAGLMEPEREKLFAILQRWHTLNPAAAPDRGSMQAFRDS